MTLIMVAGKFAVPLDVGGVLEGSLDTHDNEET